MQIRFAHLNVQGINVAIFDANATANTDGARDEVLVDLTRRARASGLAVQKSALAYQSGGRMRYYGTPDLVDYLAGNGIRQWTHTLTV